MKWMDREKVIIALELHKAGKCQDTNRQLCPYWECYDDCYKQMAEDILSLLKEQKEIKEQYIEAFNTIRDAYNAPANREKILLNYLARNACCCEQNNLKATRKEKNMSKALRCDRCDKCFVPEKETGAMMRFRNPAIYEAENIRTPLAPTCTYFLNEEAPDANLDLCPACTTDFVMFMHRCRPVAEITDSLVKKDGV